MLGQVMNVSQGQSTQAPYRPRRRVGISAAVLAGLAIIWGLVQFLQPEGLREAATRTYSAEVANRTEAEELSTFLMRRVQRSQITERVLAQRVDLNVEIDASLVREHSLVPTPDVKWDSTFTLPTSQCPVVPGRTRVSYFVYGTGDSGEHGFTWSNPPPGVSTFKLFGLYEVSEVMSGRGRAGHFCWVDLHARQPN